MLAFIRGTVVTVGSESVILDVNGIGFEVTVPARTLEKLPGVGREAMLHTYLQVLENEFKLYGFLYKEELELFRTLMSIPGMGAKTCLAVVSNIPPADFYRAIMAEDEKTLTKIPGIGKKSAQRLIFELQGKLPSYEWATAGGETGPVWEETLMALEALGYNRSEVFPILVELQAKNQLQERAEDNIRMVLKVKAGNLGG
ncbi:MAG: Holliday junction branch migration protein RuvA [Syntrophomonadaceae bacterium]|nr:Holliday junction branch migration protein RuvA [Syntrophomonadaceae bacterium]